MNLSPIQNQNGGRDEGTQKQIVADTTGEMFPVTKLKIWSHLLKKSVMENFIFCAILFMKK